MRTLIIAIGVLAAVFFVTCKSSQQAQQPLPPPTESLHLAALQGHLEQVQRHIAAGTDLNAKDAYGSTPLTLAATFGKTEVARALAEAGADLTVTDNNGSTPLHLAAFFAYPDIVQVLLGQGANRYHRNNTGSTPYDIVATPFEADKDLYDQIGAGLAPLGLQLDYGQIRATRPEIAEMLRPSPKALKTIDFTPLPAPGWQVSSPGAQGLDPKLVAELFLDASKMENVYGLLLIKNGYLIAEGYFNEGSVDQKALLQSVSKSFTSAAVGLALQQGCLSSVDQKMLDFFPEFEGQIKDPRKKEITIRHLLQMRAGYPWEESDTLYWNAMLSGSLIPQLVNYPLVNDPGAGFNYSNLSSHLLGVIVARACSTDLKSFSQQYLLDSMDAEVGDWLKEADGYYIGMAEMHVTTRDMAKLGLTYLNGGSFRGKQVVPADWVEASLHNYSPDAWVVQKNQHQVGRYFRELGYGYQWWSARVGGREFDFAWGHGGQMIVLLPEHDLVIALTSDPFYIVHNAEAWKHEQGNFNLVGKFISLLPGK